MYVPEILEVKNSFEKLKNQRKLVSDWSLPYENILTRISAAIFFFSPVKDSDIEPIIRELKNYQDFDIRENTEKKLSPLKYRVAFDKGFASEKKIKTVTGPFNQTDKDTDMISEAEKHKILYEFNDIISDDSNEETSILGLFKEQAENNPDKIALIYEDSQITFRELDERSEQLSSVLIEKGVVPDEIIGLMIERSPEMVIGILAIIKSGCTYLPIDPEDPEDRISYMLDDTSARTVILKSTCSYRKAGINFINIDCIQPLHKGVLESKSDEKRAESSHVYIIYTSGSTGKPKGVLGTKKGLFNRLNWGWLCFPYEADEITCSEASVGFVDHVAEIFSPLLKGITNVILPKREVENHSLLLQDIIRYRISRLTLVPSLLKAILEIPDKDISLLDYVKYIFCSGEHLPAHVISSFKSRLVNTSLVNIYGSSEVSADVTWFNVVIGRNNSSMKYFYSDSQYQKILDNINYRRDNHYTASDVNFQSLLEKFNNTKIPTFPLTIGDYYSKLKNEVLPYTVDTNSPYFIGHMTSKLPFYVHELSLFISVLNQNMVKLETSKSLTVLEKQTLGMLHRKIFKKPKEFYDSAFTDPNLNFGTVTSCGTIANITSLLVARNKGLLEGSGKNQSVYKVLNSKGYQDAVIIGSRLMHYSINKAASVLGFGKDNVICVDNDENGKIDTLALEETIKKCNEEKIFIIAIVGIAGATETGQIDPLLEMSVLASKYKIHFHIDAAWGGPIIFSDKYSYLLSGIEFADSVTMCGHKQFYLPQGISFCLFKDSGSLSSIQVNARYQALPDSHDTGKISIEGSRPATSLLLHSVLHIFGQNGLEYLINTGIDKAKQFSRFISNHQAFELISDPTMNIVNYRFIPHDLREKLKNSILSEEENKRINSINDQIQKRQFRSGKTFVSKTVLFNTKHKYSDGITVFRVVISNPLTTIDHLLANIEEQLSIAFELSDENSDINSFNLEESKREIHENDEIFKSNSIIGKPIPNTNVYIVNEFFKLLPVNAPGELLVSGNNLTDGYLNQVELTCQKFIWWDPESSTVYNEYDKPSRAVRAYRTGDLCRWLPDGNIEFLGRIDHQVKIRGFRIELGEIESQLLSIDGIRESIVTAKDRKDGSKYLAAYLVSETEYDAENLHSMLAKSIPDYMIPAYFMFLEKIPLLPNGKTDRLSLPDPEKI